MGRKRILSKAQELQLVRHIVEDGMGYQEAVNLFGISDKTFAYQKVHEVKREHPEFYDHMEACVRYRDMPIIETETVQDMQAVEQPICAEMIEANPTDKIVSQLEATIQTLLNIRPSELQAMRAEHRLRNIESLVKTMRLLQGESTQNIKKLSLIKAVGIATSRRKPTD
jgi:hypothetical protein